MPKFFWLQGVEDMAIWVALPEDITKREIKVVLKPSHLTVKIRDETIIEGNYDQGPSTTHVDHFWDVFDPLPSPMWVVFIKYIGTLLVKWILDSPPLFPG